MLLSKLKQIDSFQISYLSYRFILKLPALLLIIHCARHTFATTITLTNGVPIETISRMLGHTNIRTTQIYARIIDTKIDADMEMLARKLNRIPQNDRMHDATTI